MPSSHRYPPISIRPPEHLREWLSDYAKRHDQAVRAVVAQALEEFRARHEAEGNDGMRMATTRHARDCLRNALIYNFMRPDQMAWAPICFPGIVYADDGTLTEHVKAKGTQHLIEVLHDRGYVIKFTDKTDVPAALHHVLWDQWTKAEIGNGRFTGCLFDDHGQIYQGCTAPEAASYVLERLTALGGALYSYTIQKDEPL